ncbi:tyrosine-type recombinase/integrase [Saccharothrix hoggarensis]|uniref:Tyrosine-type recombinase/integrase n=1 Tax=Saccharothrix hoggarensis TaxID=913853 RepID=A0ABW3QHU0_9PSEU
MTENAAELEPVPGVVTPVRNPDGERRFAELELVHDWLAEAAGNTRSTYADAIGYPFHHTSIGRWPPPAEAFRDTRLLRNGATWISWCIEEGVHLLDATRSDVVRWTEELREAPHPETGELLSHATRAHMFTATNAFYRWAVEEDHAESNPLALVNRKKLEVNQPKNPSPTRSLDTVEIARLQWAADHDPVEYVRLRSSALVAVLYRLGMRVSELLNADVGDIVIMQGVRVLRVTLKGNREHIYKIPIDVWTRLERYLASRGVSTAVAVRGQEGGRREPLFITRNGTRMLRGDTTALIQRLAELGGVEDPKSVTPHTARHSLITALRQAGVPDKEIQRLVGHLYSSTTDRYGKHVLALANSPLDVTNELFEQALEEVQRAKERQT